MHLRFPRNSFSLADFGRKTYSVRIRGNRSYKIERRERERENKLAASKEYRKPLTFGFRRFKERGHNRRAINFALQPVIIVPSFRFSSAENVGFVITTCSINIADQRTGDADFVRKLILCLRCCCEREAK